MVRQSDITAIQTTKDIDIWIALHPDNAERVVAALREFGFDVPELSTSLFLQDKSIVRMGVPPMRIDMTTSISGVNFEECYTERTIAMIDGVEASIISLKHLKVNKKASGRLQDLNDLEHLP